MAAPQLFARVEGPKLEEISDSWQAAPHRRAPSVAPAPPPTAGLPSIALATRVLCTAARTGLSAALSSVRLRRCEDFGRTSCFMTAHDAGAAPHVPGAAGPPEPADLGGYTPWSRPGTSVLGMKAG